MSHGTLARLRALSMLVALGIGLLGQTVAAVAMPISMPIAELDAATMSSSGAHPGDCPWCPQQPDGPASPAMAPTCIYVFCSIPPAVMLPGPIVAPLGRATFPPIAVDIAQGISVRPDLGPPRRIHHS
jgi:hypothetical protein